MIICGSGHRPPKVFTVGDCYSKENFNLLCAFAEKHLHAMQLVGSVTQLISGFALAWDQALAVAALRRGIPVLPALPFKGQEARWPFQSRKNYQELLTHCLPAVIVGSRDRAVESMQLRNIWMSDHSDCALMLWDGSRGGTGNFYQYHVEDNERASINLWRAWVEYRDENSLHK